MFVNENFTFNGVRSDTLGVSIATLNDTNMFHDMGIEYVSNISVESDMTDYNPLFTESFESPSEIELMLLMYNPKTMMPMSVKEIDLEDIYDWLITEDFAPFISDDDMDLIYYFKVTKIQKHLTYDGTGVLKVTFLPYSKYCYKREEFSRDVNGNSTIGITNPCRMDYMPIIEVTNLGNASTVNQINNMTITGLANNEKIIIDNLTKVVQSTTGVNKFSCCNRKWINLKKKSETMLTLKGNMRIKVICEYPVVR